MDNRQDTLRTAPALTGQLSWLGMSIDKLSVSVRRICLLILSVIATTAVAQQGITIYQAKRIITMEPSWPEAQFVAVRDDRIVGVGRTIDDLKAWMDAHPYRIDRTFANKILMPGFVEPHIHLMLGALCFSSTFATPDDWMLPWGLVKGVQSKEAFMQRVHDGDKTLSNAQEWLFMFGYASAYHDEVTRADRARTLPWRFRQARTCGYPRYPSERLTLLAD